MGTTTDIVRNVYSNERGWTPLNYVPGTWAKDFDEWLAAVEAKAWDEGHGAFYEAGRGCRNPYRSYDA